MIENRRRLTRRQEVRSTFVERRKKARRKTDRKAKSAALRQKPIERYFKFSISLLSSGQRLLLAEVIDRYDINDAHTLIDSLDTFNQFIYCFAFHKEAKYRHESGLQRVNFLRKIYSTNPDDLGYLTFKMNQYVEEAYHLTKQDVEFMIKCLNQSDRPLECECIHDIDPEELQYQKDMLEIEDMIF